MQSIWGKIIAPWLFLLRKCIGGGRIAEVRNARDGGEKKTNFPSPPPGMRGLRFLCAEEGGGKRYVYAEFSPFKLCDGKNVARGKGANCKRKQK